LAVVEMATVAVETATGAATLPPKAASEAAPRPPLIASRRVVLISSEEDDRIELPVFIVFLTDWRKIDFA
jgi:hypothetical protein